MKELVDLATAWGPNGMVAVVFIVWMLIQRQDGKDRIVRQGQQDAIYERLILSMAKMTDTSDRCLQVLDNHRQQQEEGWHVLREVLEFMRSLNGELRAAVRKSGTAQ